MNRSCLAALLLLLGLLGPAHAAAQTVTVPAKELDQLLSAYALVKSQYVRQPEDGTLLTAAMKGMLASLDPHCAYLDKEAFAALEQERNGEYVGIGIEVEVAGTQMSVIAVTPGSPADLAGIGAGDAIVSIDGADIAAMRQEEIGKRMRGRTGTGLTVGYRPDGSGKLRIAALTRTALKTDTVRTGMAAPGVAWVRISQFEGTTAAELSAVLAALDLQGAPRGIVLDLRNDPGGLLKAAVGVAGAFLPQGTVLFSTRGRDAGNDSTVSVDERFYREPGEPDVLGQLPAWSRTVPLVVLVNGASASAAELVAGALQDHGRARVVGTRTFGKGSIQTVYPLADGGAIKLTVARYFTPAGREIQENGIVPDVIAAPRRARTGTPELLPREADLERHLEALGEDPASSMKPERAARESSRLFGSAEDAALKVAVGLLAPGQGLADKASALLRHVGARFSL